MTDFVNWYKWSHSWGKYCFPTCWTNTSGATWLDQMNYSDLESSSLWFKTFSFCTKQARRTVNTFSKTETCRLSWCCYPSPFASLHWTDETLDILTLMKVIKHSTFFGRLFSRKCLSNFFLGWSALAVTGRTVSSRLSFLPCSNAQNATSVTTQHEVVPKETGLSEHYKTLC